MYEVYGQTENAGLATSNYPGHIKIGTIGVTAPGTELKLSEHGEILLRGPHIFTGYLNKPEKTAEALRDGWLHTGDVGLIDNQGYVRITDRMKDIIITAGGKNVTPSEIENQLKFSPYISDAVVIGDKRSFLTCLVMIDHDNVVKFAQDRDVPFTNYASLCRAPGGDRADRQGSRGGQQEIRPGGDRQEVQTHRPDAHGRGRRTHPDHEAQARPGREKISRADRRHVRRTRLIGHRKPGVRPPRNRDTAGRSSSEVFCREGMEALKMRKLSRLALSTLFAGTLTASALAEDGVSATEILIGSHTALSGPVSAWGIGSTEGTRMRFDEANEKGIHGRKIKLIVEDTGYQVPRAVQAANKLINNDKIFLMVGALGTPMNNAVFGEQFAKGVPNLFPLTAARSMAEPLHPLKFTLFSSYYDQVRASTKHFVEKEKKSKVCVMYQDTDFGHDNP